VAGAGGGCLGNRDREGTRSGLGLIEFRDFQAIFRFKVAFAAEPVFHGNLQAVERDAVAGFEEAVGDGEGVVKDGVVGEVAHGEVVDLVDGAGVGLAGGVDALDGETADEHDSTLTDARRAAARRP